MCDAPKKRPSSQNIPRHKTSLVTKHPLSQNVPRHITCPLENILVSKRPGYKNDLLKHNDLQRIL